MFQVAWDPTNPELLASTSEDKLLKLWDTRTNSCATTIELKSTGCANLVWSPDGQNIVIAAKVLLSVASLLSF